MPPQSKPVRLRQFVIRFLLALGAMCAALLLLEAAVRLLPPPYPADTGALFACQPSLGWTGRPYFADILEDASFRQELQFNALGMHDTDHPRQKPPGAFRILLLGDSFVQAVQVAETETAHQALEDLLNQQGGLDGRPVEVISGGVVNWGTAQALQFYRDIGRGYQPDLVILMVYLGNDVLDNLPGNGVTVAGFNCYAPYFARCAGQLDPRPLTYAPGFSRPAGDCPPLRRPLVNAAGWLYQHSRLYQQLEPLLVAAWPRQEFGQEYPLAFSALYLPEESALQREAWAITEELIAQLQQEVRADGAAFGAALISPEVIVRLAAASPGEQAVFLRDNPAFAQAELERPTRRLADFFEQRQIPFIDLLPPMAATQSQLYLVGEGHWNEAGNRLAAKLLAEWILAGIEWDADER